MSIPEVRIIGIPGIPIVEPGADLVALIHDAAVHRRARVRGWRYFGRDTKNRLEG